MEDSAHNALGNQVTVVDKHARIGFAKGKV